MDFLRLLESRSSADSFDESYQLPSDLRESILESMNYSPRAANLQQFSVRYFESREDLSKLSQFFGDCPYLKNCSMGLIFFVDLRTTDEWMKQTSSGSPFLNWLGYHYGFADSCLALAMASIQSETNGLQTRVLSHGLQRARAAAKLFNCPSGIIPALILSIGKSKGSASQKRHNQNSSAYCVKGFNSWKTESEVYVQTGKEAADLSTLRNRPEIAAKMDSITTTAGLLADIKYPKKDLNTYSDNLLGLIEESFSST